MSTIWRDITLTFHVSIKYTRSNIMFNQANIMYMYFVLIPSYTAPQLPVLWFSLKNDLNITKLKHDNN